MFDMTSLKLGDHVYDGEGNLYVLEPFDECYQHEDCHYEYQGRMVDSVGHYPVGSIIVWDAKGQADPVDQDLPELDVAFAMNECPY